MTTFLFLYIAVNDSMAADEAQRTSVRPRDHLSRANYDHSGTARVARMDRLVVVHRFFGDVFPWPSRVDS
jgi:hypothetical protein